MAGNLSITLTANIAEFMANINKASAAVKVSAEKMVDGNRAVEQSANSLVSSVSRSIASAERLGATMTVGAKGTAEFHAALANIRGVDPAKLEPGITKLRDLESAISVAQAAERSFAATQAFDAKAAEAAKLNKASEYVRWWEDELQKAEAAERKFAAKTDFISGLEKQASAIGKTRADLLEMKAAEMGVADQAAPFIAKLRASEQAMGSSAAEAKRMQWALQGVPAQFTDIAVSIAGGQNPMMVFLQQGGQLRDMFGSAGQAAKALGGYIIGLVSNPITVGIAAVGALTYAYYQGAKEQQEFAKALIMTGNAAGVTAGQLSAMARAVSSGGGGTQWEAAEALTQLVATGKVTGDTLTAAADAAVRLKKFAGVAIEDTVKNMAELGKSPYESAKKLDGQYKYLTASTLNQIKAYQDEGRQIEAAKLAQESYADGMNKRTKNIEENLGNLEKGWIAVRDGAKGAWDAMLGVGRQDSPDFQKMLEKARDALKSGWYFGTEQQKRQEIAVLEAAIQAQNDRAAATQKANEQDAASKRWNDDADKYLQQHVKILKEVAKVREEGARAGAEQAEIDARVAKIMEGDTEHRGMLAARFEEEFKLAQASAKENIDAIESLLKRGQISEGKAIKEKFEQDIKALQAQATSIRNRMVLPGTPTQERSNMQAELNENTVAQDFRRRKYKRDVAELDYTEHRGMLAIGIDEELKLAQASAKENIDAIESLLKRGQISEGKAIKEKFEQDIKVLEAQADSIRKRMDLPGTPILERANMQAELNENTVAQDFRRSQYGRDVAGLDYKWNKDIDGSIFEQANAINERAKAMALENETRGKTTMQVETERLARMRLSESMQSEPEQVKVIIAAQERYVAELEKSRTWEAGASDAMKEYMESASNAAAASKAAFSGAFKSIEDSIVQAMKTGKLNFGNFVDTVITGLVRMYVQAQITAPIFNSIQSSGGIGSLVSSAGTWFSSLFGGGKAIGGPVQSGMMYEVTEGGRPELLTAGGSTYLMMGGQAGVVTPASSGAGAAVYSGSNAMTVSMPVTIDARGASADVMPMLQAAIRQLQASIPGIAVQAVRSAQIRARKTPGF